MTFIHREQYSFEINEDQDKSKFVYWMENNKQIPQVVNVKSAFDGGVCNFVWDSKAKSWAPNIQI